MNRIWVVNLYDVLRQQGFEVFLDQVVLRGGDELIKVLEDGLSKSQAGILIWSSASADSDWVRREYATLEQQAGDKASFCFVPVVLDKSKPPVFARNRVFFDFSEYPDGPNGGDLLRLLHSIVGMHMSDEAVRFATDQDAAAKKAAAEIDAAAFNKDYDFIIEAFATGGLLLWETSSALGCKAAKALIDLGRNDDAISMLATIEKQFPRAIRPRQLHALALARRGDLKLAQRILGELYASGAKKIPKHLVFTAAPGWTGTRSRRIFRICSSRAIYMRKLSNERLTITTRASMPQRRVCCWVRRKI